MSGAGVDLDGYARDVVSGALARAGRAYVTQLIRYEVAGDHVTFYVDPGDGHGWMRYVDTYADAVTYDRHREQTTDVSALAQWLYQYG